MMMLQFDEEENLHKTEIDDFEIEYVLLMELNRLIGRRV